MLGANSSELFKLTRKKYSSSPKQNDKIQCKDVCTAETGEPERLDTKSLDFLQKQPSDLTVKDYDGSNTHQAGGSNSNVYQYPAAIFNDSFRGGTNILVLGETYRLSKKGDTSNITSIDSDFDVSDVIDTRVLRRSKRNLKAIATFLELLLFAEGTLEFGKKLKDTFFPGRKYEPTGTTLDLEALERSVTNSNKIEELERSVMNRLKSVVDEAKDYWAINRENQDLLLGNKGLLLTNRGLLLANQGLLLANTGLLIGVAFMFMNINSKLDRNYEAIKRVEGKVDRNYVAIRRVESKIDRNLEVMLSKFKILEYNLTNVIEKGFKEVIDFVRQTRIEGVTSELITFIRHFIQEKDSIRNLTHDQYINKLEEVNGILHRLQNSRLPQSGSLHTLLYNIINQRFAIPEKSNDRVALTALGLLCSGTETYTSVMSFLLEEYSYLANFYYQQNELEKYNHYFSLISTTFNDFKNSLAGDNGLINEVISILNEVKSYDFIKNEREDVVEFASKRIDSLNSDKSKLVEITGLSQEKPSEKIKYNFSNSRVKTPIGNWEDRRQVSYAIQFQSDDTDYQVGEWSKPARIYKKANPLLDIGTDPRGRSRLIFRKFDTDKPELIGIVEDGNQKEFRDINRDLYNAALEPNEDVAIDEINVFFTNGADIHAIYEKGRQAIHAAAESGNSNVMLALINKGADINAKDTKGYAPIHIAAGVGYENFVMDLVDNGANVNVQTNSGETALHIAAEKGHVSTVACLMKIEGIDVNARNQRGFTPLHVAASFEKNNVITTLSQDNRTDTNAQSEVGFTPLHLAAIGEYSDAVEVLLASDRVEINAKTQSGLTALHFASLIGNLNIVNLIIGHNKANINEKSTDGWTSLHLAINSKHENVALKLISTNNIEINAKAKDDLTPLHLASSSRQKRIVLKMIEKRVSIEDVDKYGYTPLHFAIESGDLDVVKCLVEKGANLYAERKDGYTPLGLAAFNGRLAIVQFLVNDNKVDVNTKNKNTMAPIDFAASNGYFDIVEFLIDKGSNKESALHWAAYGGHLSIVRYLVDEKRFDVNIKDRYGNIPLHNAVLRGHLDVVKYFAHEKQVDLNTKNKAGYTPFLFAALSGHFDVIKYFMEEKNVNLNSSSNESDNNGSTALHLSALNSNLGVIKYLIRKGANVNALDNYSNTPLFLATSRGNLEMVKYIIQKGAYFEITNSYGNTPLHFAAWNGHLDIVKYFAEKGVDLNIKNHEGNTSLHLAASTGNLAVVEYLISKGANFEATNSHVNTCLQDAAFYGKLEIVEYLAGEKGADFNNKNSDGNTPPHLAAANGKLDVVKYLIEEKEADFNVKNNKNYTPLHLAAVNGHFDAVKYLAVKFMANNTGMNAVSYDSKMSQDMAAENGNINIVMFLEHVRQLNLELLNAAKQGNTDKVKEYISKGASLETESNSGVSHEDVNKRVKRYGWDPQRDLEERMRSMQLEQDRWRQEMIDRSMRELQEQQNRLQQQRQEELFREMAREQREREQLEARNLLFDSAAQGNLNKVKEGIDNGASVNAVMGEHNLTLLHYAAKNNRLEVVKFLIDRGADINAKDNDGLTPLESANNQNKPEIVRFLSNKKDNQGNTVLHYAAEEGNLNLVTLLLKEGASVDIKNTAGSTPLHLAAKNGKLEVVKFLIDKNADINATNYSGSRPLELANNQNKQEVVSFLVNKKDKHGNTLLHYAAKEGKLNLATLLVEKGADLNVKDTTNNGEKPIHLAVKKGQLEIVKFLLDKGSDVNDRNNYGNTPLILAVWNGKLDVVKYLIDEKGADLNAKNNDGSTPLMLAVWNGKLDIMKYFIDEKGVDLKAKSSDFNTLLHLAAYRDKFDVIKYLVDDKKADLNIKNNSGWTPLQLAAIKGRLNVVKYFVMKGVDLNTKDSDGNTSLLKASINDKWDVVKFLIEKGANTRIANDDEWTVLHASVFSNNLEMLKFLLVNSNTFYTSNSTEITQPFSLNVADKFGQTPLHIAAGMGNLEIVKYLIEKGVDLNAVNKYALTSLQLAANLGKLAVVKYLTEKQADLQRTRHKRDKHYHRKQKHLEWEERSVHLEVRGASHGIKNLESTIETNPATSGVSKPSSWINDLCGWIKEKSEVVLSNVVNGLYIGNAEEVKRCKSESIHARSKKSEKMFKATLLNVSHSGKSPVQGVSKENVSNKGWSSNQRKVKGSTNFVAVLPKGASNTRSSISEVYAQPDITGLMLLAPIFKNTMGRKFVLPLLSADQSISTEKASVYASNIINRFTEVLEQQAALKDGIRVHRFKIDFMKMHEEITGKIIGGKFDKIPEILKSYAEKACPGREAGCSGRLSQKKFYKFNSIIDSIINQSMHQMLSRLEVSNAKEQQISLKPKSYLNGTSVQGHLIQDMDSRKQNQVLIS